MDSGSLTKMYLKCYYIVIIYYYIRNVYYISAIHNLFLHGKRFKYD